MRLRLYSFWTSSASYRVRIAPNLKAMEHEIVPVDLVRDGGQQWSAAYRAVNPQSRVPALQVYGRAIRAFYAAPCPVAGQAGQARCPAGRIIQGTRTWLRDSCAS
ncbi:MAG: hypothetical protein FJ197_08400 [Gammaproteobacteria bacterium]|nr:hypothetical protein [Gammaproteobacteria bacterium]